MYSIFTRTAIITKGVNVDPKYQAIDPVINYGSGNSL